MSGLKLYYDLMSQPSRAVWLFLKTTGIPFEEKPIALRKGEHMTEEYEKINPFRLVPAIDEGGFLLTESIAIMQYLCGSRHLADHWYPSDAKHRARINAYLAWHHLNIRFFGAMVFRVQAILKYVCRRFEEVPRHWYPCDTHRQAKVDEFCAWQHMNIRLHCMHIFDLQVIEPRMKNIPVDKEKLARFEALLSMSLDYMENVWLKDTPFICSNNISIADIICICEIMQTYATNFPLYEGRPRLEAWAERVKTKLQPHFDTANVMVYKVRENFVASKM